MGGERTHIFPLYFFGTFELFVFLERDWKYDRSLHLACKRCDRTVRLKNPLVQTCLFKEVKPNMEK